MASPAGRAAAPGPTWLGWLGAAVLLVGLALAYASRDDTAPQAARAVLLVGTAAVLGAVGWRRAAERSRVPPAPWPAWCTVVVGAVGVGDLAGGLAVTGWLALLGLALIVLALLGAGRQLIAPPAGDRRTIVRAAQYLGALAGPGAEPLTGTIEPVGRGHARVVVVAPDGRWDAVVVAGVKQAEAVAELAGVTLSEATDPAWSAPISRGPAAWSRLSGPRVVRDRSAGRR